MFDARHIGTVAFETTQTENIRMKTMMTIIIILANLNAGRSLTVFKSQHGEDNQKISVAKLQNYPEKSLPQQLVLCSSSLQGRIGENTKTLYVLYEDESYQEPWLSVGFWEKGILWANIEDSWYLLGQVLVTDLFRWIHLCVEIDFTNSIIKTSINGGNTTIVKGIKEVSLVPKFHLVLGVVHNSWYEEQFQFDGLITNIHLLEVFIYFDRIAKLC